MDNENERQSLVQKVKKKVNHDDDDVLKVLVLVLVLTRLLMNKKVSETILLTHETESGRQ